MSNAKLFLIDAHALCYRSFYALPSMINSKGQATNAVYGFLNTLKKILKDFKPEYLAVCFDSKGKTLRQEKFAEYKIQRPSMPDELRSQIPIIKNIIKAYNLAQFEASGFEADDIIASLTKKMLLNDLDIVVVSEDKDMFQLADKRVKFLSPKNNYKLFDEKDIAERLGFNPQHIVDFIALAGDASDNIPGVKGIGAVSAKELIVQYGTLENMVKKLRKEKSLKKTYQLLIDNEAEAIFSKELALLEPEVPISADLGTLEVKAPNRNRLFEMFQDLEFKRLSEEFAEQKSEQTEKKPIVVKTKAQISTLIKCIQTKKKFSFLLNKGKEASLFDTILISIPGDNCVELGTDRLTVLKEVWRDPKIKKITYDLKGSLSVLEEKNVELNASSNVFDVMLAGFLLGKYPSSFKLGDLTWDLLKVALPEDSDSVEQGEMLLKLVSILEKELKSKTLDKLYADIELPLTFVLHDMEKQGVNLDAKLLKKLSKDCARQITKLVGQLYKISGEEFNLNSPKQLSQVLFEKLKLPVIKKTKTGFSTNEEVLTILSKDHEFPSLILEYRQLSKLKSTYFDAFPKLIDPQTGFLHTEFLQTGTETGRLSSRKPNLQNIPIRTELGRQIRKAIIPSSKDLGMISADYSQIELRILAHLSDDKNLKKAFVEDQDIHDYTASLIFDVAEEVITPEMRTTAKRVNFGIIYGMSAFGLAKDLKIQQDEAQTFIDKYFTRYPKVKTFMDKAIKNCERDGYVQTLLNRRRYIPGIKSSNNAMRQFAQRQAINTPVQGSAADLIKLAMLDVQREIQKEKLSSKMLISVHDELVFEGSSGEQKVLIDLVRKKMEHSIELSVPIKVSIKAGKNWLDMEEW